MLILSISGVGCYAGTIIYIANTDSQDISVFSLDELTQKTKLLQTYPVGGAVMPLALSADKHLLYAAIRSEPYRVVVSAIDPATGKLSPHGSAALVDSMANIALDPGGRYLFAASYGGNKISMSRLDSNGIPETETQVLATGAHPHQITADPANHFIYVSLLGADRLGYFRMNSTTEKLQQMSKPAITFDSGSGPRHFVFSATGKFIYLLDELHANLHVLKRNIETGTASLLESHALLPEDWQHKAWAADIHMTPNGKFLYASERNSNSVSGFSIKPDGRLSVIGRWDTELQPRAFGISPDGNFLAAVGQKSHGMSLYSIHPDTGELKQVDRQPTGKNPGWVEMVSLPASGAANN
jgi:6-phosphogluconolactonase